MSEIQTTVSIWKNEGETPLEALGRFRFENPAYKDAILSYAGRLDPMAEGVLLVLVNDTNKEREKYLGLDKEYEVEILFGVSTDTGDVLGIPQIRRAAQSPSIEHSIQEFQNILPLFVGITKQKYPSYSSKTVKGKPLFQWAREGKIDDIEVPERESEIYSIELLETSHLVGKEILEKVKERISKMGGDFRQEEILKEWQKALEDRTEVEFQTIRIKVKCSSGAYMRTLAERISEKLGTTGLAWSIKRTKIFI